MRLSKSVVIFCVLLLIASFSTIVSAKTKLTWYYCCAQKERADVFNKWAREFEQLNPDVTIDASYPASDGGVYYDKITVGIASDMAPDVVWLGNGLWGLADMLMPLDDLYNTDSSIKEIIPAMIANHRWNGNLIAIPFGVNTHAFFYNKDALAASGLVMPKDWTWDDAIPMFKKLTYDSNADGNVDKWGLAFTETAHVLNYEGNVYTPDWRKVTLDNPVTIAAAQLTSDIFTNKLGGYYTNSAAMTAENAFFSGVLAMQPKGVFDLVRVGNSVNFDWDITMFPKFVMNGKEYRSSYFSQETWAIYKGTKEPELAKKFISFLMKKEHMGEFAKLGAVVPTQPSVAVQYFLNAKKPSNIKAFTDTLSWYKNSERNHPAGLKIDAFPTFLEVMRGTIPAVTGIPELARQMNAALDEYWANRSK